MPRLPVVVRPPRLWVTVALVVVIVQPSRQGSLLVNGLLAGPTSRPAVVSYVLAAVGSLLVWRLARTRLELRPDLLGRPVLVHQSLVRRRVVSVSGVRQVSLVAGPAGRAILLDARGRLVTTTGPSTTFWRRDDVVALLAREGVVVRHEHRLNMPRQIEAAFPGATAWIERHPLRLVGVVVPLTLVAIAALVWFLEV